MASPASSEIVVSKPKANALSFAARRRLVLKRRLVQQDMDHIQSALEKADPSAEASYNVTLFYIRRKYESAIMECDRELISEFFVKIDSLRVRLQLQQTKKLPGFEKEPQKVLWGKYLIWRYGSIEEASNISIWSALEEFHANSQDHLNGSTKQKLQALNLLRCAWRYYRSMDLEPYVHHPPASLPPDSA